MPHTILRLPTVKARTGLSRSTIYHRVSCGTFPTPVPLGGRAVGWIEGRGARVGHRADRATPADHARGAGSSSHDPAQDGGAAGGQRQARRGRSGARRIRMTVTGRGNAHPVQKRKGGRHDSEHHR